MAEKFYYKAKNIKGKTLTGVLESADEISAEILLIEKGYELLSLRAANIFDELNAQFEKFQEKFSTVGLKDIIVFTRQFATLFSAGIPVVTIFERLKEQNTKPKLKKALESILKDVEAGSSLSFAFSKHNKIFSSLYVGMIKVGEEGGVLDIILERLAKILETQLETQNKIKSATRYPKMVVSSIVVAFTILLTFVVPKFVAMFSRFNAELPLPTKILILMNNAFQHFWWLILSVVIIGFFGLKQYRKTAKGKYKTDEIILKIPIIGDLLKKIYIARIVRILGLLYRSGIPITTSFEIVSEVSGNEIFKKELNRIKDLIAVGTNINSAVKASSLFPLLVGDMIESGEETGQLDDMLFKVAEYFDEETEYTIDNLSTAIEPILLAFIAGMVLLIALGVFLPMWDMIKVFKG